MMNKKIELRIEIPSQIKRGNGLGHADSEGKGNLGLRGERRNLLRSKKIIGILLLVIMFTSPFAFASGVRLVKVSDLQPGDIIIDEEGNEFEVGEINEGFGIRDLGFVGITGTSLGIRDLGFGISGMAVGGLGRITGMVEGVPFEQLGELKDGITYVYNPETNLYYPKEVVTGALGATPALTPIKGSSWLSEKILSEQQLAATKGFGLGANALISGISWAAYAYMAGQMIGSMFGMTKQNTKALSTSLAAGFGSYKFASIYQAGAVEAAKATALETGIAVVPQTGWASYAGWIGLGIGIVIFVAMYKKTETKVVEFNCMPWQAPVGGNVCEECNDDDLPCSEYRCKSLGQNCELVNAGTADEKCVNVNPRDVNPPTIKPNYNVLSKGHEYTNVRNSPPGPGFNIVNMEAGDGCLKAFTPLEFGINVDEPAQCKIDFNHTESFDEMVAYIGGKNLYSYNHTEKFSLPSIAALKNASMVLENGKDLTFFIRCKDKNGNENGAEYAVNFCVDPTPDNTAPKVEATSVLDGGCVAENQDTAEVVFYTNEPADCRWSSQNQDYDNMQNTMSCSGELYQSNAMQLFSCATELTGISREDTKFYVRCKDQPGADENDRNENKESFEFSLRGSTGLKMKDLQPNGTIFGAVSPMPVELKVKTLFGCNDGQAICKYSATGNSNDYIQFFDTNNEDGIHTQRLDLIAGEHEYFVQCVDEGGNLVEDSVIFNLDIDMSAPVVARIYEEEGMLKIVTVRDSECSYSFDDCDFSFAEGTVMPYANSTVHVAEWNEKETYYIKCRDEFRNEDADCSVAVRPSRNFL